MIRQAMPCFRRPVHVSSEGLGASIILNIVLALLLGLYSDANRKPSFTTRATWFTKVHALLTSDDTKRQSFISNHPHIIHLALLEYCIRVIHLYMPVEEMFLTERFGMGHYFEHSTLWGDEFRASITPRTNWDSLNTFAGSLMERGARVKGKPIRSHRSGKLDRNSLFTPLALELPVIPNGSAEDYAILVAAYKKDISPLMAGEIVRAMHSVFRVIRSF